MAEVEVVIFHQPPRDEDPPLVRLLAEARDRLVKRQRRLFERAGATRVAVLPGREDDPTPDGSFGARLARWATEGPSGRGLVVMGSGAVPRLLPDDARRLVATAAASGRVALTNNRFSSDICAVSGADVLADLPALPSDNALPRWLEEHAGFAVSELRGRDRLALDLDTPQDVALLAEAGGPPRRVAAVATEGGLAIPNLAALRGLAADPHRELLVFGRAGSRALAWLERNVRCRVRFLAEERGLRASSPLAISAPVTGGAATATDEPAPPRPPRATLGRLLADRGPGALAATLAELADGAIVDSRVLLADRFGADETAWPSAHDRFASDLLRSTEVRDPWLRELTASAADAGLPILLGGHTLVGVGLPVVLRRS